MKLSKKLLPLTGIVTSFAVVAPITACSNNSAGYLAKATSFNYKPTARAKKGTIEIDDFDSWDLMQKSYFSDKSRIAQDLCYIGVQQIKEEIASLEDERQFTIDFEIAINSINIGEEKVISWIEEETGVLYTQKGYVFSVDLQVDYNCSYFADKNEYFEITQDMTESQKQKMIQWRNRTSQIFMEGSCSAHRTLNNYFAYLTADYVYDEQTEESKLVPALVIEPHDIESIDWEHSFSSVDNEDAHLTFVNGETFLDSEVYKDYIYYSKAIGDTIKEMWLHGETGYIGGPSYYLSNVNVTEDE